MYTFVQMNVYTAWLTLELKYGEEEKSFDNVVEKACEACSPKLVHLRAGEQLENLAIEHNYLAAATTGKSKGKKGGKTKRRSKVDNAVIERAENFFAKMVKKFKPKKKVWLAYLKFLLIGGKSDEANDVLKRR